MKLVWKYDLETKELIGNGVEVGDDYALKVNETFVIPQEGLLEPIVFNGSEWTGANFDDWIADQQNLKNPSDADYVIPMTTEQDKINAQLLQQAAAQQITNAAIVKQIATIKGGE